MLFSTPLSADPIAPNYPPYRAPWWLPGGHLQTLYPALFLRRRFAPLRRQRWELDDGDFVDVDWTMGDRDAPLVVLFHGLEGSARGHYAGSLMRQVVALGWRGAVVHFRGCSGEPNRLARAYHSGDSAEIEQLLRRFRADNDRLYAVGVSLGGNALLKWLGEHGADARRIVTASAAVSTPFDLMSAGRSLDRGLNRVLYTRHFLRTLKQKAREKLARFPGLANPAALARVATLHDFDQLYTAPVHGYKDADDYWRRASSKPWLSRIAVPTLVINACNDPFMPATALPTPAQLSTQVTAEFSATGGHAGFVSGSFPGHLDWLPARILAFFRAHGQGGENPS